MTEVGEGAQSALALAKYDEMGLELPPGLSFEDWRSIGAALLHMEHNVMWWLGDHWRYGEREYGEAAAQAAPLGYALETVRGAAWVADNSPSLFAGEPRLPFSFHKEVAALPADEADELLDRAERDHLTRDVLRQEVRQRRKATTVNDNATAVLARAHDALVAFNEAAALALDVLGNEPVPWGDDLWLARRYLDQLGGCREPAEVGR